MWRVQNKAKLFILKRILFFYLKFISFFLVFLQLNIVLFNNIYLRFFVICFISFFHLFPFAIPSPLYSIEFNEIFSSHSFCFLYHHNKCTYHHFKRNVMHCVCVCVCLFFYCIEKEIFYYFYICNFQANYYGYT